ncbi:MAG: transcription-repair coupling factor [candidate division Zixibacteria bacterium]|nr:transcription-repair coupling factor [candidate division Zixibacteria bacterium]
MPEMAPPVLMREGRRIERLLEAFRQTRPAQVVLARLEEGREAFPVGLSGSARSFLLAAAFQNRGGLRLAVVPKEEQALALQQDLTTLLPDEIILYFPSFGIEPFYPHRVLEDISGQRIAVLSHLTDNPNAIVVTVTQTLLEPTMPKPLLVKNRFDVRIGQELGPEKLMATLEKLGYHRVPLTQEPADYSVRGGIVDLFPPVASAPVRVEFFGDRVESLRAFSVLDQRSKEKLESFTLLPNQEVLVDTEQVTRTLKSLPEDFAAPFFGEKELSNRFPALEYLAPFLGTSMGGLEEYLSPDLSAVAWVENEELEARKREWLEKGAYNQSEWEKIFGASGKEILTRAEKTWDGLRSRSGLIFPSVGLSGPNRIIFASAPLPGLGRNLSVWAKEVSTLSERGIRPFLFCETEEEKNRIGSLLEEERMPLATGVGRFAEGFIYPDAGFAVFTGHELFGRKLRTRPRRKAREGIALASYTSLTPGDFVVHVDYGVGRFAGLASVTVEGEKTDCLHLAYAGGDKLYVPIEQFRRVQKYAGKEGEPALTRLGTKSWERAKEKVQKALAEMAGELVALYAARKSRPGHPFSVDSSWMRELETSFPYDETPDQNEAIEAVRRDMEFAAPMDRLVLGDVGFGKTEVAVRASLKAVADGKQAAVLVPTTILALQHYLTFGERLLPFPVRIELLSRFRPAKEQKKVVAELKKGTVDIVIGTHRLLAKDVAFKDPGLLVIDEEHRFGVVQKEKLKKMKETVDVLTLSATPIPRTLQLSLSGARDLSVISTPPRGRLPIQTEILPFSDEAVRDAVLFELERGGQVFFVHNRVETIEGMKNYLLDLIPGLKLGVAHGQLSEETLERVMVDFLVRKFDLLLSTSIIESGLDIPSVNTLIVNRADRFGLAQLYQLRGRVGRSSEKAFAYFFTPPWSSLTDTAKKRLKAIAEFTELGSGFYLAMRDLEIRGAGNLLGAQQHGFIEEVGFDLYCELLEEAVARLKGEAHAIRPEVKLSFPIVPGLPEDYVASPADRIEVYKRLSELKNRAGLEDFRLELEDRFGPPPPKGEELLKMVELKLLAEEKKIGELKASGGRLEAVFTSEFPATRKSIEELRMRLPDAIEFAFAPGLALRVGCSACTGGELLEEARKLLSSI